MQFVAPMPFVEAAQKLGGRSPIGSKLNSQEWSNVPLALRERAIFSATIENVRFLQRGKDALGDFLASAREEITLPDGTLTQALKVGSRAQFIAKMREFAVAEGLGPLDPKDVGGLKDIRSEQRLGLIFDVQTQAAQAYGSWKQGMDPDVLNEFPAQRFIREVDVSAPRIIHLQNEGVVRLKTDLAWWRGMNSPAIGGFGVPWGPWGFNSGMGVEDVDRDQAEEVGLITRSDVLEPVELDFNEHLKASVKNLDPEMQAFLRKAFGSDVRIENGAAWWKGDRAGKKLTDVAPRQRKKPTPEPPIDPKAFPDDPAQLEVIRRLGGSTGAELVRDRRTGQFFVRKMGASAEHLREEVLADQMYQAVGASVPEARLYETGNRPVKLARYVEGKQLGEYLKTASPAEREAVLGKLKDHFATDALMGNWDVVGMNLDNVLVDAKGIPWRIDNGGSLRFRAQGARKTQDQWNEFPSEVWTLRDRSQSAGSVFGDLGIFRIGAQIEKTAWDKAIALAPDDLRGVMQARLDHMRALGAKAVDMQHDGWKEAYTEKLTRHMLGLRQVGIVRDLPKQLTQDAGNTAPVDERGNPFDDLRTRSGTGTDPYWNDLLAAVKTLNKHGSDGGFQYNATTVAKALAHKDALGKFQNGDQGEMFAHYHGLLHQVEKAKEAADKKQFVKIDQATPFTQRQSRSVVTRFSEYIARFKGNQEVIAEWMESQAGDSWNPQAQAYKKFVSQHLQAKPSQVWWKHGVKSADDAHSEWIKRWGDSGEESLIAWHALVQEVLGAVEFRHNDRSRRAVRLIRTEKKAVMTQYKITHGTSRSMPRGLNESSSVFRTTTVFGTEITVQAVPHSRITGLYLLERRPGARTSSFLGDGENEFTFVPYEIPFSFVPSTSLAAGNDASLWSVDISHLRIP